MSDFNLDVLLLRKVCVGGWVVVGGGGAQQNRVTPSPFNFGLWTLDLDLDCDNYGSQRLVSKGL